MDFKKTDAPLETITYDRNAIDAKTDNIYEAISIISKRTIQINESIKKELLDKLEEFASPTESLDEIFENKNNYFHSKQNALNLAQLLKEGGNYRVKVVGYKFGVKLPYFVPHRNIIEIISICTHLSHFLVSVVASL